MSRNCVILQINSEYHLSSFNSLQMCSLSLHTMLQVHVRMKGTTLGNNQQQSTYQYGNDNRSDYSISLQNNLSTYNHEDATQISIINLHAHNSSKYCNKRHINSIVIQNIKRLSCASDTNTRCTPPGMLNPLILSQKKLVHINISKVDIFNSQEKQHIVITCFRRNTLENIQTETKMT